MLLELALHFKWLKSRPLTVEGVKVVKLHDVGTNFIEYSYVVYTVPYSDRYLVASLSFV